MGISKEIFRASSRKFAERHPKHAPMASVYVEGFSGFGISDWKQRFQKEGARGVFAAPGPLLLKFFRSLRPFETIGILSEGGFGLENDGRWSGVRLPVTSQDVSLKASSYSWFM